MTTPAEVTTLGVLAAGYPAAYGIGCALGLYDKSTCTTDQLKDGLSETTMWGAVGAGVLGFFAGAGYECHPEMSRRKPIPRGRNVSFRKCTSLGSI